MGLRSWRAIQSLPFIKHIVNILSENLGAEAKDYYWICGTPTYFLSHTRTHARTYTHTHRTQTENQQHKHAAVVDSRAITIDDNIFCTLYQNQGSAVR